MYIYLVITLRSLDVFLLNYSRLEMGVLLLGGGKCWVIGSTVKEVGVEVLGWGEVVELSFLWWLFVFLKSEMSWEVSVMGVVNIISGITELVRVVESVELVSGSLDVVLNTISIEIVNLSLTVKVLVDGDSAHESNSGDS